MHGSICEFTPETWAARNKDYIYIEDTVKRKRLGDPLPEDHLHFSWRYEKESHTDFYWKPAVIDAAFALIILFVCSRILEWAANRSDRIEQLRIQKLLAQYI